MTRTATRLLTPAAWVLGFAATVLLLLAVGRLVPSQPVVAGAAAVGVLALGLTLAEPALIPLLALPVLFVVARVSGVGVDLSFSDLALFIAFWPALLAATPFSRSMRSLLWLSAGYQVATLFTVVANPYAANVVEWLHEWLLVSGALILGWAVGRRGFAKLGLSLILLTVGAIALLTIFQGVRQAASGNLEAVYLAWPYAMHKNFIGTVLGFGAIVAYAHPGWMGWSKFWALSLFWLCAAGMLFSQSRQALIGLSVGLLVIVLRKNPDHKRSKVIVLAVAPALALVGTLVQDQVRSGNQFNSVFQRLTWLNDSLAVLSNDPVFGVGLRWWYTDRFPVRFQPPNAELEVLTSAGVVGLAGFLILFLGASRILWKVHPNYGTLALSMLLMRFTQGQFDLFWVAVQVSVPFVVVGICLGAQALGAEREQAGGMAASREKSAVFT